MLTFGGMWRWRRVAVARVFALVVRCRVMRLLLYSRVGKNRDTRRGSPAGAGAGRTADHLAVIFSQKVLAVRSAYAIYRPVMRRYFIDCSLRRMIYDLRLTIITLITTISITGTIMAIEFFIQLAFVRNLLPI